MLWLVEAFQYIYILIEFVHFEFVELSFAVGLLQLCLLVVSVPSDVVFLLSEPMGPLLVGHVSFPDSAFFYFGPGLGTGRDVCAWGHKRGHSSGHGI